MKLNRLEGLPFEKAWEQTKKLGAVLNDGNPWKDSVGEQYDLKKGLGLWKAIGADSSVISWIAYGVPMRFQQMPPKATFTAPPLSDKEKEFVNRDILQGIKAGLFQKVDPSLVVNCNPIIVVANSKQKLRRCDDMRFPNAHVPAIAFCQGGLEKDIQNVIQPGDVLITEDIKKAYYKVGMAEHAWKHQAFYWEGTFYWAICMLFGYCLAPFYFTKICRPLVRFFGSILIRVMNMMDDWLFGSQLSKLATLQTVIEELFSGLGWILNEKGEVGFKVIFLGMIVDAVKRTFSVPSYKIEAALAIINEFAQAGNEGKQISSERLRSLIGQLQAMRVAITPVQVWTRELYTPWANGDHPGQTVALTPLMKEELAELRDLLVNQFGTFHGSNIRDRFIC